MATEPTKEAIQVHQRRILEEALENARETINLPSEFHIELENALDANERGDVDGALEIAQQVRDEAEHLSSALDDIAFSLKHIDEDPPSAPSGSGVAGGKTMSVFVIEGAGNLGAGTDYVLVGGAETLEEAQAIGDRHIGDPDATYDSMFITEMVGDLNLATWRKDGREGAWYQPRKDGAK